MLSIDRNQHALAFWLAPVFFYFAYSWLKVIYGAFFGPLSKLPGPKLWAISRLPRMYMEWQGHEATGVDALHKKYGPIVRLAPNEVSFAGGVQAWVRPIEKYFVAFADQGDSHVFVNRKTFMATERTLAKRNTHIVLQRPIGLRPMELRV